MPTEQTFPLSAGPWELAPTEACTVVDQSGRRILEAVRHSHSTGPSAITPHEAVRNAKLAAAAPELLALLLEAIDGAEMEIERAERIDAVYLKATGSHLFTDPVTDQPAFGLKAPPKRGHLRLIRFPTGDFATEPVANPEADSGPTVQEPCTNEAPAIDEPEHALPWYRGED